MLQFYLFAMASALSLGAALAVFFSRRLLHSVLALTIAFIGSSAVFLVLGQAFIALLQLFIFVGGLSTYLVVAIAAEETKAGPEAGRFIPLLVVVALGISVVLARITTPTARHANGFVSAAGSAFSAYYPVLIALALLLFSAVLGSVMIIKRFMRLIV